MTDHACSRLWHFSLPALILGAAFIVGQAIETRDISPTLISVGGEGKAYAIPDIAYLNLGVDTGRRKTAEQAMERLKTNMNGVFDAVTKAGIEEKDIQTQSLSLHPAYDYNEGKRIDRGFEARQSLRIKVRDLSLISTVLDAAVTSGANDAGGVQFNVDDIEAVRRVARQKAIDQAQEKARILSKQLGRALGELKDFSEGGGYSPPISMMRTMEMDAMGGALPVPAGEQEISVAVQLTYELE